MKNERGIDVLVNIGLRLKELLQQDTLTKTNENEFVNLINTAFTYNGWFTPENVRKALTAWTVALEEKNVKQWLSQYNLTEHTLKNKKVGLIMAGNIPLVGLHDLLCVLVTGNTAIVKPSSDDTQLMLAMIKLITEIAPELTDKIKIANGKMTDIDAIIATGSNNSARYFDYYFGKYPNIIRKNRHSVAVITGEETEEEMTALGQDVFAYFGLGCRNVSKLFVPKNYSLDTFFKAVFPYKDIVNHNKYANNYDYNKTIYLMSQVSLLENGFLLLKEDSGMGSPVAVMYYEYYNNITELQKRLHDDAEQIQCIVGDKTKIKNAISFGTTQTPALWDYADGIDTIDFLLKLK